MTMQLQGTTFIRLGEMIDQAIGTPEVGVVDFNMLQLVLHVIVQQLNLASKPVELRGSITTLPVGREHAHTVNVQEFEVEQGPKGEIKSYKETPVPAGPAAHEGTILVAERVRTHSMQGGISPSGFAPEGAGMPAFGGAATAAGGAAGMPGGGGAGMPGGGGAGMPGGGGAGMPGGGGAGMPGGGGSGMPGGGGAGMPGGGGAGTYGGSTDGKLMKSPSGNVISLVPLDQFQRLAQQVQNLEDRVNSVPPTNAQLIEGVRSQTNMKAITDMWNTVNVQGRLDAAEAGIAKLSSLVEDIIAGIPELKKRASAIYQHAAETAAMAPGGAGALGVAGGPGAAGVAVGPGAAGVAGGPGTAGVAVGPGAAGGAGGLGTAGVASGPGAAGGAGGQGAAGGAGGLGAAGGAGGPGAAGVAGGLGAAGVAGGPGAAGVAGGPGAAGVAGGPGAAGVAGGPGAAGVVGGLGAAGVAGGLGAAGVAGGPGAAGVVGGPGAAGVAGGPGAVGAPNGPFGPGGFGPGGVNAPVVSPAMLEFAKFLPAVPGTGYRQMSPQDIDSIISNVNDLRNDLNNMYGIFFRTMNDLGIDPSGGDVNPSAALSSYVISSADTAQKAAVAAATTAPSGHVVDIPRRAQIRATGSMSALVDAADINNRILALTKRLDKCECTMGVQYGRTQDKIGLLEDQVNTAMVQNAGMMATDALAKPKPGALKDLSGLMQLYEIVNAMQVQLKELHNIALVHLASEREDRKHILNGLIEQVELLKAIKMDREDMAEAMAGKADLRMLARKVSHEQFEMACDDLAKGLEQAIGKLNLQESLWQQALDDIQREIETKLNKLELNPVKEFFSNKLKQLQENLKQLAQLHREVEAAGTKRKLMRDVNCISCDANAVMNMEAGPSLPGNKPITAIRSMKPYLTYELDSIRKAQAANVQQRNMHDWEQIDKQMGQQPGKLQKVRSDTDKHLCNRYCGGSHTVTTPAQRVARTGHFIKQWGPDVLPLSTALAAGDDGKMYKVVNVEVASAGPGGAVEPTCTPRKDEKRKSSDAKPIKPIIISAECRCLEKDAKSRQSKSAE